MTHKFLPHIEYADNYDLEFVPYISDKWPQKSSDYQYRIQLLKSFEHCGYRPSLNFKFEGKINTDHPEDELQRFDKWVEYQRNKLNENVIHCQMVNYIDEHKLPVRRTSYVRLGVARHLYAQDWETTKILIHHFHPIMEKVAIRMEYERTQPTMPIAARHTLYINKYRYRISFNQSIEFINFWKNTLKEALEQNVSEFQLIDEHSVLNLQKKQLTKRLIAGIPRIRLYLPTKDDFVFVKLMADQHFYSTREVVLIDEIFKENSSL